MWMDVRPQEPVLSKPEDEIAMTLGSRQPRDAGELIRNIASDRFVQPHSDNVHSLQETSKERQEVL